MRAYYSHTVATFFCVCFFYQRPPTHRVFTVIIMASDSASQLLRLSLPPRLPLALGALALISGSSWASSSLSFIAAFADSSLCA